MTRARLLKYPNEVLADFILDRLEPTEADFTALDNTAREIIFEGLLEGSQNILCEIQNLDPHDPRDREKRAGLLKKWHKIDRAVTQLMRGG